MPLPLHDVPESDVAHRASDADREHAARVVHAAAGAGMLTMAETEERLSAVYAARFRHELTPLVVDLPVDEPVSTGRPTTSRVTGVRSWLRRVWVVAVAMAVALAGWVSRHRVAAVLLGVLALGVAGSLVMAFGDAVGVHDLHGEDDGGGMTGH